MNLYESFRRPDLTLSFLQSFLAISTLVIVGPNVEMPVWLGDFTTMVLASTSTAVSALFALTSPLSAVLKLVFKAARWIVSSCSMQSNAKVDEVFSQSTQNVKEGAQDEMQANLEEGYDEPEDEDTPSKPDGHTNDDAEEDTEEAISTGVVGIGAAAAMVGIAAAAAGGRPADDDQSAEMQLKLGLDFPAAGLPSSPERAEFELLLVRDLSDASGVTPTSFHVLKMSPGSIIIEMQIRHDPGMGMGGPSAQNVAEDLQRQVTDANSALRRGAITCYAEDIYIPPKQGRPELLSVVVSGDERNFTPAIGLTITDWPPHRVLRVHDLVDKNFVRHDEPQHLNPPIIAGDFLLKVDGRRTEDVDHGTVVSMLHGPLHSTVILTLARADTGVLYEVEALRHVQHSFEYSRGSNAVKEVDSSLVYLSSVEQLQTGVARDPPLLPPLLSEPSSPRQSWVVSPSREDLERLMWNYQR